MNKPKSTEEETIKEVCIPTSLHIHAWHIINVAPNTHSQDGTSQTRSELNTKISKLTKEIAEKDMKLGKQEQALEQAKRQESLLKQELTNTKEKKRKAKERTSKLMLEKTRLETTLLLREQEIESLKQSAGEDSAQVKEMIARKEKEYEEIKMRLETLEAKLAFEKEKVTNLQVEKVELQKNLDLRDQKIQFLKKSFEREEKYLQEIITNREQQILEHKEQLKKVKEELESQKMENTRLQEHYQKVTMELQGKRVETRRLHAAREEAHSQLKQERERVDKLIRESMAAKTSPKSRTSEPEVIKAYFVDVTADYHCSLLMSICLHLSPGSPYVNCLYKYHVLSLWHTFLMGHTANFLLERFHV